VSTASTLPARRTHLAGSFSLSTSKEATMTKQDSPERSEGPATTPSTPQAARRNVRGFAAMDRQRQREIASLGGRAAHQSGHAHEFTSEEARAAGRKRHAKANGSAGSSR
jgi:general stress protein YciG